MNALNYLIVWLVVAIMMMLIVAFLFGRVPF